jgi:hypothetical protein
MRSKKNKKQSRFFLILYGYLLNNNKTESDSEKNHSFK